MRLEQRMTLAPRMIQSMEILQLSILALQERIEQELSENPVLELVEPPAEEEIQSESTVQDTAEANLAEKDLIVDTEHNNAADFERLDSLDNDFKDYMNQSGPFHLRTRSDDVDGKLQAIKNTAAPSQSLHEHLMDQWRLIDVDEPVRKAGTTIIDYIDDRGYLSVRLEQLHNKDKADFSIENLKTALKLVQRLEPAGVGARDLAECLLIQMAQSSEDMTFEARLVNEHMNTLLDNHLPEIARKMKCTIDRINDAVEHLSKLDTSPGLLISQYRNQPVTADVIIERDDSGKFFARLAVSNLPTLRINREYENMAKDNAVGKKTRDFLKNNIRSAQWIMDAIEQRKSTLLKVTKAILKFQTDFFEKGQLHMKPLPMAKVADYVGVHIATVSRAVAGKYVQCEFGILPLRKFFSGGTEDVTGNAHSWQAVRAKLQQIVDSEDKTKPLNDKQILNMLLDSGIKKLSRRTVAKYRKLMNIPSARFRKKF